MPKFRIAAALAAGLSILAVAATAQTAVVVGGAPMFPTRTIVENAANSKDHTTLVAAVQAAGLAGTLGSPGPFTVFAPTNRAFGKLPKGTVEKLVQPAAKGQLTQVLTYHVVPGRLTAAELMAQVKANGGRLELTTVEGDGLVVRQTRNGLRLTDTKGRTSNITIPDVLQSNGVIHVVDTVLMPS